MQCSFDLNNIAQLFIDSITLCNRFELSPHWCTTSEIAVSKAVRVRVEVCSALVLTFRFRNLAAADTLRPLPGGDAARHYRKTWVGLNWRSEAIGAPAWQVARFQLGKQMFPLIIHLPFCHRDGNKFLGAVSNLAAVEMVAAPCGFA